MGRRHNGRSLRGYDLRRVRINAMDPIDKTKIKGKAKAKKVEKVEKVEKV